MQLDMIAHRRRHQRVRCTLLHAQTNVSGSDGTVNVELRAPFHRSLIDVLVVSCPHRANDDYFSTLRLACAYI